MCKAWKRTINCAIIRMNLHWRNAMNIIAELKSELRAVIDAAIKQAMDDNALPSSDVPSYVLETPKDKSHGDYATNVVMLMTKALKMNPRAIAEEITKRMNFDGTRLQSVEIAGPGFLNFRLKKDWWHSLFLAIQTEDGDYGKSDYGKGKKIQVEFVSANPTGLLHMGNARGGALGDVLASVLNHAGFVADKEYYINDAGNQVRNLALSVEARYFELLGKDDYPLPEDGYQGEDIKETAKRLLEKEGERFVTMEREARLSEMLAFALEEKVGGIRKGLEAFGVTYDNWFSEERLHESGAVLEAVNTLKEKGFVYEKEGALWLACTKFGEEKDEVLVRSNGTPTYFAADIAYHKNKFDRGYAHLINIWGADHHGHVARLKNAMTALGYDGEAVTVILMQLVRLYRDGELVKMSKRKGTFVTLEELMEEVGTEAARFFFSMRNPDSAMDFDLDLAKKESSENPVYYVQYAHARIVSILQATGLATPKASEVNLDLLKAPEELALIELMARWTEEVALSARDFAPYHLPYYAKELANAFHSFYNACKVLTDDEDLKNARLVLADCARITLRNVLHLIGVSAPDRM